MRFVSRPAGYPAACCQLAGIAAAAVLVLCALLQPALAAGFLLLQLDGTYIKWGKPQFGAGATVSYAILDGNRQDPDAINCKAMTGLEGLLGRSQLAPATFDERLQAALSLWQAAANIRFVPAASAATADIVIGAQAVPRGIAYTNVQHQPVPGSKFARLGQATICLNPMVAWRAGGRSGGKTTTYELRRVLAHELGHAVGLDHPGRKGELMGYAYQENIDGLTGGDIAGIETLYGVPAAAAPAAGGSPASGR